MPVRDQIASASASKSRSGMFKWMISGHKGHKHKQEKLNNAVSNKNKNNLKQQQNNHNNSSAAGSGQQHEQGSGEQQLHMSETNNSSAYNNQVNSTQEHSSAEHVNSGVSGGDINQNVEKCDNVANTNGHVRGVDRETTHFIHFGAHFETKSLRENLLLLLYKDILCADWLFGNV
ncbi:homeobox protein 4-like [Penaeus monodon]|uniref:homeobox protein 4-like n=1 Tax=Penaeus monodon TaxID=6687 RepID=UPI0018A71FF9|nr:homeobox protein 4-like [Penaeus monodon]